MNANETMGNNKNNIGWIFILDSNEKQKTSKPVKLEVCAIQIYMYMYCYGGYFAHNSSLFLIRLIT